MIGANFFFSQPISQFGLVLWVVQHQYHMAHIIFIVHCYVINHSTCHLSCENCCVNVTKLIDSEIQNMLVTTIWLHMLQGLFKFDVEHFDKDILNNLVKIQKDMYMYHFHSQYHEKFNMAYNGWDIP